MSGISFEGGVLNDHVTGTTMTSSFSRLAMIKVAFSSQKTTDLLGLCGSCDDA